MYEMLNLWGAYSEPYPMYFCKKVVKHIFIIIHVKSNWSKS
jgi:hypothetical protein